MMPWKTILTLGFLAVLLRVPDYLPAFKDFKVLDWASIPHVLDFVPRRVSADPVEDERAKLQPDTENYEGAPARHLIGKLDAFFESLRELEAGRVRKVRILHYGDSPTTADMITADARVLLQKRFGDAGHGYHLIAKPWAWYEHRGVSVSSEGWKIEPATAAGLKDGLYGLGGVSFRGETGARSRFWLRTPHPNATLDQAADSHAVLVKVNDSSWEVQVPEGSARVFGVSFDTGQPGVEYDSLGLNGAYISVLAKMFNEKGWGAELAAAKPNLVIVNYGTNESMYAKFVDYAFEKELRQVIKRIRMAVPEASLLVMSPMDRGMRSATGEIITVPALNRLVNIEQRVANDEGVAFFNTFQAMGGEGTMGRWYEAEPRLIGADFIHPMPKGAKIVGGLLYEALMDGYQRYKTRMMLTKDSSPSK